MTQGHTVRVPFSPPLITDSDINAVTTVLQSGWITTGPVVQDLQAGIATLSGTDDAVALNSCTAALELSLRLLGIGPGDDVLVPAYTYSASAAVIHHVGARIIFVDNAPGTPWPDIEDYLRALTNATKAIITVDLAGVPYPSHTLREALVGQKFQARSSLQETLRRPAVIADAAHSLGARRDGESSGALADFTAFSFHAVKNLTTAEGGALTWRKDFPDDPKALSQKVRRLSLHGQSKDALAKSRMGSWDYDIVEVGYKYNMPDTLAALGLSQLSRYEDSIKRRHDILNVYAEEISQASLLTHSTHHMQSSGHLAITQLPMHLKPRRNNIIGEMGLSGIVANVHYKPLPLMTAYKALGHSIASFPNALSYYEREITLPLYPDLSPDQIGLVVSEYNRAMRIS